MKPAIFAGMLAVVCGLPAMAAVHPPMGFDLDVTLSAKASDRLRASKEGITVSARYYGNPTKRAQSHANEVGQIDLGGETLQLPGHAGLAHVSGTKIFGGRLAWIQGEAMVNVNVYSSRRANKDNILDCDFIDAEVARVVKAQPVVLHCALIEERAPNQAKP